MPKLYGDIIKGKEFMSFEFTDKDFSKYFGKEDAERFSERLGKASYPRPVGSLIWLHAASVGEAISILPLIDEINEKYAGISILLTTGTVTSSQVLSSRLPKNVIHQ